LQTREAEVWAKEAEDRAEKADLEVAVKAAEISKALEDLEMMRKLLAEAEEARKAFQ